MRIRDPKTTALIFASGKMVVTGAKSEDDSRLASRKYARIIQKLGFNAKFTDFKIQNIVVRILSTITLVPHRMLIQIRVLATSSSQYVSRVLPAAIICSVPMNLNYSLVSSIE